MIWKKQPVGSKLSDLQNNKASKDTATQSAAGLMSAADKTKLDRVGHTTIITATTLADLKTNLLNAVNGVDSADMLAVRISPSFSSDRFTSGSTYGGYAYNIYKASGTTSYFSVILSNNIGEDMFIGYNNGTWKFNSLNSKTSITITEPSGWTFNNNGCYKVGRTVCIIGSFATTNGTSEKTITFSNVIPSNFRPEFRVDFAGFNNATDRVLHGIATSNGNIVFYRQETESLTNIAFSLTYIL